MRTEDLKNLFEKAYAYSKTKFGKKADTIEIEEDGSIKATWSTYAGCGDWDYNYETFKVEELFNENTCEQQIKPCPFCGGDDIRFSTFDFSEHMYQDTEKGAMKCEQCDAMGGVVDINVEYKDGSNITDYASISKNCLDEWNNRLL